MVAAALVLVLVWVLALGWAQELEVVRAPVVVLVAVDVKFLTRSA